MSTDVTIGRVNHKRYGEEALYMPSRLAEKYTMDSSESHSAYVRSQPASPTRVQPIVSPDAREAHDALGTIKWDSELGPRAASAVVLTGRLEAMRDVYPDAFPHAQVMFERFTFQQQHYNISGPSPLDMVIYSLSQGPAFTERWGKAWKDSRFGMMDSFESIAPFEIHGQTIRMDRYDDVYSPYFFIFWEEESDDWKYMFSGKPDHIDPTWLDRITDECASIASKYSMERDSIIPVEHIYRPVATNGFDGAGECCPEWELEFDKPTFDEFTPYMIAYRSIARKRPTEVRDIGILSPGSLKCHREFMYPLQRIASRLPMCPHGKPQEYIRSLVRRIGEKNSYFFMRDYTKSGMTVPHPVIRAVFRGVYADDDQKFNQACNFYEKGVVMVDTDQGKAFRRPDTGVPLGLWVEGYTILQYAIHNIVCAEIGIDPEHTSYSATNDDMVFGSEYKHTVEAYRDLDCVVNSGLGMLVKFAKSGISEDSFIYCEEYWKSGLMGKTSLFSLAIIGAKSAVNIVHAKDLVHSILMGCPAIEQVHLDAVQEVQNYWGFEFSDQEYEWPFLFGGWLPQFKKGVDHSLEWFNGDFLASCAYWAARIKFYKKTELDIVPHLSLGRKLEIELLAEPEDPSIWADLVPLVGSYKTLKTHFGRLPPKAVTKRYKLLEKARYERFTSMFAGQEEVPNIYLNWYERHPNSVIKEWMPGVVTTRDLFVIKRPRLGLTSQGLIANLINMQAAGILRFSPMLQHRKVSKNEGMLFSMGITKELSLSSMPVPRVGLAPDLLKNVPPDWLPFYERTGKALVSLTGDPPMSYIKYWEWCPLLDLITTRRIVQNTRRTGYPNTPEFFAYYQARILGIEEEDDPPMSWWDQSTQDLLPRSNALRMWEENAPDALEDEVVQEILRSVASRLVPRYFSVPSQRADAGLGTVTGLDPFATNGSGTEEPDDGWQLPEEGYDIWASLGDDT